VAVEVGQAVPLLYRTRGTCNHLIFFLVNFHAGSKTLSQFHQKVNDVRCTIDELLNEGWILPRTNRQALFVLFGERPALMPDEDLNGMYLTEAKDNVVRRKEDHAEVELLLETYLAQTEEILNEVDGLISNIRSTEDIVNIILDAQRNALMLLELKAVMATLAINSTGVVAAILGMNLRNSFEDSATAFVVVSSAAVGMGVMAFIKAVRMIRSGVEDSSFQRRLSYDDSSGSSISGLSAGGGKVPKKGMTRAVLPFSPLGLLYSEKEREKVPQPPGSSLPPPPWLGR
ncbi:MAG: hypothetical protein BJ554DRAFT_5779, partial [Olpidium bornovanus]